jgi:predicted ArsR family transcriptional regulator
MLLSPMNRFFHMMGRGRKPTVSDDRLLLEILLQPDRAVYSGEVADNVDIGQEAVRKRFRSLEEDGLVEVTELESHNIYRITEDGYEQLAKSLRDTIS